MRKVLPVVAAVAVVGLLAGFSALMWKVEKRGTEDDSVAMRQAHRKDAALAASLLPLLDRLQALEGTAAALPNGSQEYEENTRQALEVRNLLASQMPGLSAGRDESGNAVLIPLADARQLLVSMASWRED